MPEDENSMMSGMARIPSRSCWSTGS